VAIAIGDVRFTPESRNQMVAFECPLWVITRPSKSGCRLSPRKLPRQLLTGAFAMGQKKAIEPAIQIDTKTTTEAVHNP
jgi:hypothetical protein